MLSGCPLAAGADNNIYVLTQPAVCCSAQAGARALAPVVPAVSGKTVRVGGWLVWPQQPDGGTVGVKNVASEASLVRFEASGNNLVVSATRSCRMSVYGLDGRLIARKHMDAGTTARFDVQAWPHVVIVQTDGDGIQPQCHKLMCK